MVQTLTVAALAINIAAALIMCLLAFYGWQHLRESVDWHNRNDRDHPLPNQLKQQRGKA